MGVVTYAFRYCSGRIESNIMGAILARVLVAARDHVAEDEFTIRKRTDNSNRSI